MNDVVVAALLILARKYADADAFRLGLQRDGYTFELTCVMPSDLSLEEHLRTVSLGLAEPVPSSAGATPPSLFFRLNGDDRIAGADLVLSQETVSDEVVLRADFDDHTRTPRFVERLLRHLSILIRQVLDHPRLTIAEARLLSNAEEEAWELFNDTCRGYPREARIFDLFAAQVAADPDRVAVLCGESAMTYGELLERSEALAAVLHRRGVRALDRVALQISKSPTLVVALLAILRLGAAYVPIDPHVPPARCKYLLADSGATLFLVDAAVDQAGVPVLDVTAPLEPGRPLDLPTLEISAEDPAYVMYTSGTTGHPKGVVVNQRAVARLVRNGGYVQLSPATRILQTGAIAFDATTFEFWAALLNGGALILVSGETILSAAKLRRAIARYGATMLFVTTGLFNQLTEQDPAVFDGCTVLFGGEYASADILATAVDACPGSEFVHVYGPTENTTFSLAHSVSTISTRRVPIGRPIANSTAWVLDRDGNPQPIGVPGELCVGGDGLAVGYRNRPELDAKSFITRTGSTERLYRTGDIVVLNSNSDLEFIGRADDQVKIRGYRVELGEVETHLENAEGVDRAIVLFRRNANGLANLCGFFTASRRLDVQCIRATLGHELPEYMVPASFKQVDAIPLTTNGKVDKNTLAGLWPTADATSSDAPGHEPLTPLQAGVADIFADVLELEVTDADADFFVLGGHSLAVMRVQNRIKKRLGVDIRLREILAAPTVRGVATAVERA